MEGTDHIGMILDELYDVVVDRKKQPKAGAYTTYLFEKGTDKICKKILEEAGEMIIAAKNNEKEQLVDEIADMIYHINVLMVDRGLSWEDIAQELTSRRK